MKILIVDDEQMICTNIASKIKRLGFFGSVEIYTSNTVKEAELLYDEHRPDIVFTDIRIPVTNGITLVERLRQKQGRCVIFAVSGYDDYAYVRKAFLSGVDDYILKPLSINDLSEKLKKARQLLGEEELQAEEEWGSEPAGDLIARAQAYISLHYTQNLTLAEVADSMSVSYSHFSHLFRKTLGMTFPAYLLRMRMEKAAAYLQDPDLSITQIAEKVGYEDANHFSRAFKRYTGRNPSDYRRSQLNMPNTPESFDIDE